MAGGESADSSSRLGPSNAKKQKKMLSLHEIVAENDVQQLVYLLAEADFINLNERNEKGETPLHVACKSNSGSSHIELSEMLLKNGANPNARDSKRKTPIWYLVQNPANVEILKLFLRFEADFTLLDKLEGSLWSEATKNCHNLDVVKFLVEDVGLDINHRDGWSSTPLHEAATNNQNDSHYDILEYLLEKGADVNARDHDRYVPLYHLVRKGNLKVFDLFYKYNGKVRESNKYYQNLLFAFQDDHSNVQVLERLLNGNFGLDLKIKDICGRTILHYITDNLHSKLMSIKVVKCLLKHGVDINESLKNGLTPLYRIVHGLCNNGEEKFVGEKDYFDFLLEQIDFSVVHGDDVHVLCFYDQDDDNYEVDDYDEDQPKSELWKWILEHLAKLKLLEIPIHPMVLEFIENDRKDFKDYFEKCTKELEIMSNTKFQNSWLTYFNLLADDRRKLKNYAANEDLVEDYKKNDWLKMFPIYGALLKKKMEKGIKKRELFDKSSILFSERVPIFNCTHLIVKDIFDCILSKKDLSKFCE